MTWKEAMRPGDGGGGERETPQSGHFWEPSRLERNQERERERKQRGGGNKERWKAFFLFGMEEREEKEVIGNERVVVCTKHNHPFSLSPVWLISFLFLDCIPLQFSLFEFVIVGFA